MGFGEGFVLAPAAAGVEVLLQEEGKEAASEQAHPVAAFGLEALHPGLFGEVNAVELAADAAEGQILRVGVWRDGRGRSQGGGGGGAAHQGFHVLAQEAAVAAGGAIDGETAAVSPLAQGGFVDFQSPADFAQGHPAGSVVGGGRGGHCLQNLYKSVSICLAPAD